VTSRWTFLALVIAATLAACSPADPELEFIGYPIINGTPDTSQEHMAVVGVFSDFGMCTGTLIHHRVVLTAAHCVDGSSAADMVVAFGDNINWGGGAIRVSVADKWQHPSYSGSQNTNDIALLRLSESPPVAVDYIPHLPESLQITTADIGTVAEYVGFGQTSGSGGQSGIKMTMTNQIEWVCYSASCSGWDNPGKMNTFCEDQSPSGVCFGDSGGPALITRSGTDYTAGVASYVGGDCRSFGCHTKVDEYEYYIQEFITMANGAACVHDSECESGICSDHVCCNRRCIEECMACDLPGSEGQCLPAPDGYFCPDFNKCDGMEVCQGGVCTESPDLDCDDNRVCTIDSCEPSIGCIHEPVPDGTSCSDNDICNGVETCQSGVCRATGALDCDDGDPCTFDSCHPVDGCQHTQAPDGTSCGDNNDCNGTEVCVSGVCQPGSGAVCDDGNPCTDDQCIPGTGCVYTSYPNGTPCDDGDICTTGETCSSGVCTGTRVSCDDNNSCTEDSCDPVAGCLHTAMADGTACGGGMCGQAVCMGGLCQPVDGVSCEDYDPCTKDWCDPQQGCLHESLPDGYECGKCYMCVGGQCIKVTDCGGDGGCGCGVAGHELPLWMGLCALALLVVGRRRR